MFQSFVLILLLVFQLAMSVGSFLEPCVEQHRYRPMGFKLGAIKKNLLHVFGSQDDTANHEETIKVYLRLKPPHSHHDRIVSIIQLFMILHCRLYDYIVHFIALYESGCV